jgi:hypothetical protein
MKKLFIAPANDFGSTKNNPSQSPKHNFCSERAEHLWHCGVVASHQCF